MHDELTKSLNHMKFKCLTCVVSFIYCCKIHFCNLSDNERTKNQWRT